MSEKSSLMSMPAISFLGTMMSFTVTFSRSRMPISMSWCFLGIRAPASFTSVLNSSRLRLSVSSLSWRMPNNLSILFVIRLVPHTRG